MPEWDIRSALGKIEIGFQAEGSGGKVQRAAPVAEAAENDLAFCWYVGEKGASYISKSKARVILCKSEMKGLVHSKGGHVQCDP